MAKAAKKATKKATKKAVAKREDEATNVAAPSMMDAFAHDAGEGLENIRREDTKIPFLQVLQALSPQIDEAEPTHIEDARAGMIVNTVTNELWDGKEGVLVIPVHFEKKYIEWVPRTQGGGFVAEHATREDALENKRDDGTEIVDTAHHYVLARNADGVWFPCVIPCTSTKLSVSRGWNAMMQSVLFKTADGRRTFTPPSYACIYSLTTARQQNDKGTWHNLVVERVATVDDPQLYAQAKAFRHVLVKGGVALDYDSAVDETAEVTSSEPTPSF